MSEFLARLASQASQRSATTDGSSVATDGSATARPRLPERFAPPDVDAPTPGDTSQNPADTSLNPTEGSPKPLEESQKIAGKSNTWTDNAGFVSRDPGLETLVPQTAVDDRPDLGFETLAAVAPQPTVADRTGFETRAPQPTGNVAADCFETLAALAPQPTTHVAALTPQSQPLATRQPAPSEPDVLHVTIGRIDVRIPAAPAPASPRPAAPPKHADRPSLSLSEYLDGKRATS